jgi:ferredoxin-NADP reductase
MAGTAISGRLAWRVATLVESRDETPSARTLVFDVPGWPGHLAGQHVDVRLTAEDGYSAQRSYSLATPSQVDRVELTVQLVADGEVSSYLHDVYSVGDPEELRRPEAGVDVTYVYTRETPEGWPKPPGRLGVATINSAGWAADFAPRCFVCGPTGFVETVANILVALDHDPRRIKTERFGPTGA